MNEYKAELQIPKVERRPFKTSDIFEPTTLSLIAVNLITIGLALFYKWSVASILYIYWLQSVGIGLVTFYKLFTYKVPEGPIGAGMTVTINDRVQSVNAPGVAKFMAFFFLFHYGMFHFVYIIFLLSMFREFDKLLLAFIPGVMFLGNHIFSYITFRKKEATNPEDINKIFGAPYSRIIPMHLTIIFGGFVMGSLPTSYAPYILLFFMLLKTASDVMSHVNQHREIATQNSVNNSSSQV